MLPFGLEQLRIGIVRPAALGRIARYVLEGALVLAAWARLRRGGRLQDVAALGALPPTLRLFLLPLRWFLLRRFHLPSPLPWLQQLG